MASIIYRTIGNPLPDHVNRCLIKERSTLWHTYTPGRRALELLNQVTVVGIARCNSVESSHLQARYVDERREAVRSAGQIHAGRQGVTRRT